MENEPERIGRRPTAVRYAYRRHEVGAFAVGNQVLVASDHLRSGCWCLTSGCWCLTARWGYCSQGQTASQRGAVLEEFPSIKSFRTHRCSFANEGCRDSRGRKYTPGWRRPSSRVTITYVSGKDP